MSGSEGPSRLSCEEVSAASLLPSIGQPVSRYAYDKPMPSVIADGGDVRIGSIVCQHDASGSVRS